MASFWWRWQECLWRWRISPLWQWGLSVVWCMAVTYDVIKGMTETEPGPWLRALLMLVFFTVMAWRFFAPSLLIAPAPIAPLTALGAAGVAGHGLWSGFSLNEAFSSGQIWYPAVIATLVIVAAIASPFTGVPTPMTGSLIFPLREGRWLVIAGQGRIFNHHWPAPEQREALDLVRLRWTGRARRGLGRQQEDFPAFGTELLAPCSGIVVHAQDGLPDGVLDLTNAAGNHVIIDNGHELIALAHLRQSTVAVRTGDHVRAGDRIGEVGNSGNSSEPHLHIHASRNGQPLRLRFSDVTGRLGKGRIISTSPGAPVGPPREPREVRD